MHHYIPIERNLSDLVDKLNWAKKNDQKVQQISEQAQQFANEYLTPDNVLCYHVKLFKVKPNIFDVKRSSDSSIDQNKCSNLQEWSERLVNRIEVQFGVEKLTGTNDDISCECELDHAKLIRDEL